MTDRTAIERYAEFACQLDPAEVPAPVLDAVDLHLLDVLGCGLAAVGLDAAPYAGGYAEEAGAPGPAATLGLARRLAPEAAALANGMNCHALDFDDTHPASIAHVSAVVAPAALAAAEAVAAPGSELAAALLAGNEITTRIGRAAGDAFHLRGFHPTAICGVFGATAAVGRLRGSDERQLGAALGIAGSMASGLMAYLSDGSETKRLHPGWMAHAAQVATGLAAHGASGPAAALEGRFGVFDAFLGERVEAERLAGDLGSFWETPRIAFKPYPACHFIHAPLDALVELQAGHGFAAEEVERITVLSPRAGIELISEPAERKRRPATPYEGKFSAPFALAAWLRTGAVDATTFGEPLLSDPAILELAARVGHEACDFESFPESLPGGVRVELSDGRSLEARLEHQRGGELNPMSGDEVVAKFRANAALALDQADTALLERACLDLPRQPGLDGFSALTRASAAGR